MAIKPIDHYSITNIKPSVYDEEAMTALELVGRIGQRLNEAIAAYNELEKTTNANLQEQTEMITDMITDGMPAEVEKAIKHHIALGDFDRAINIYLNNLNERVDNLLGSVTEGSTTMDAEIIDARLGGNGVPYENAGEAIRGQYNDMVVSDYDKQSIAAERYGYRYNHNRPSMWEQGWLNSETGEPGNTGTDNQMFIRTRDFIPDNIERIISPNLRLEIFVYYPTGIFSHKEERCSDYVFVFDHEIYKYKIHATGNDANILNYHSTKTAVTVADSKYVYFLGGEIVETPVNVSALALERGYHRDLNYRSLWSQGYIYGSDGTDGVDPRGYDYWLYSRSGLIPSTVEAVSVKDGFKARLFRYAKIGADFIDFVNVGVTPVKLDNTTYRYRLDVTYTANELGDRHDVCDMWSNVLLLADAVPETSSDGEVKSPFDKGVYFPPITPHYTSIEENISEPLETYDQVIAACDSVLDNFFRWSSFVIGQSCDGRDIKAYKFESAPVDESIPIHKPTIIIVGGQHGFEKANVMGIANLMTVIGAGTDLRVDSNLNYLVHNVNIICVPVANPSGYDASTYKNSNGVNLNRNYDYKWSEISDTTSDQYGGAAPFDQPETQAIRDLILNTENVCLVIDSHSMGSGAIAENRQCNWISAPGETDSYYKRMAFAAHNHQASYNRIQWLEDQFGDEIFGYIEGFDGTINVTPSLDNWCVYNKKIHSLTFEGFNAYPGETTLYSQTVINKNTEMLLNFILWYCAEFSR